MLINLLIRIYAQLRLIFCKLVSHSVIYNVNRIDVNPHKKRALLVYILRPFFVNDSFFNHQNSRQSKQIANILGEFGYIVDVADVYDNNFRSRYSYDLIMSHSVNMDGKSGLFKDTSIKIYLTSGMNTAIYNQNLKKRHENLKLRKGADMPIRQLRTEYLPFVLESHAIIGFGNEYSMGTWREIFTGPIFCFNNYGFRETKDISTSKDYALSRRNFLFFGSGTQIGKGLDILLDIFTKYPELHLYICSNFRKERVFSKFYYKELYQTANVHPIGLINPRGQRFYDLCKKCAYVILPSASEGQAGSVVQCIYTGLVPIITREVGIDANEFGVMLKNDTLEHIEDTVVRLSKMEPEWIMEKSRLTRKISEEKYSEDAFMNRWREILKQIIHSRGHPRTPE